MTLLIIASFILTSAQIFSAEVILFPQWHLAPKVNTKFHTGELPQTTNQLSIYNELVKSIDKNKIKSVIVEGCEGEITLKSKDNFNGWTVKDLSALPTKELDHVMAHIGLKLEAKYKDGLKVLCGDNLELIKKNQLAYSDLRGLFGFKMRLEQHTVDANKKADYLKTIKEVLKLPSTANEIDTEKALNAEIRKSLIQFHTYLKARNQFFVDVSKTVEKPTAIVIGALHIKDLEAKLPKGSFEVFAPKGLNGDEDKLIQELERFL
jgi:hypothetical protein